MYGRKRLLWKRIRSVFNADAKYLWGKIHLNYEKDEKVKKIPYMNNDQDSSSKDSSLVNHAALAPSECFKNYVNS